MTDLADAARIATDTARLAGLLLRQRPTRVEHKGAIDLVTEIDLASEACIREELIAGYILRLKPSEPLRNPILHLLLGDRELSTCLQPRR